MNPFAYKKVNDAQVAISAVSVDPCSAYIAGGTTIIDLMKDDVLTPSILVDITSLSMRSIASTKAGGIKIGALATMADVADSPDIRAAYPLVSQALLASASPQLRNMATIGGNILQRTRCSYFRDVSQLCNKRSPGLGCAAIGGQNRSHAVIGTSDKCICVHASDLAVVLLALEAIVHVRNASGSRAVTFADLYVLPGEHPDVETTLDHGDLIEAIELPPNAFALRSSYLKVRDRASYEFALVSVAAALDVQDGAIHAARVGIGGVAPVPWRAHDVETALVGRPANENTFAEAAQLATRGMRGYGHNDFKIPLTQRSVARALHLAVGVA
jgi:xanthine dehydrogenase YagS FAD-binding subunit